MTVDAWAMAAECARAVEACESPTRCAVLRALQKLWIELGERERLLSEQEVLKELKELQTLHAWDRKVAPYMHGMPPERPVAIPLRLSVKRLKPA